MKKHIVKRYSAAFRQQVVAEYENGASVHSLRQKYGIGGGNTINQWVAKYGRAGLRSQVMYIQKPDERTQIQKAQARIKELEALAHRLALDNFMLRCEQELLEAEQGFAGKKRPVQLTRLRHS